jgi:hypothetical protein
MLTNANTFSVAQPFRHLPAPGGWFAGPDCVPILPGGSLDGVIGRIPRVLGLSRRAVLAVLHCFAGLATVAPARRTPPVPTRSFPVRRAWSRRHGTTPALPWLHNRVPEMAACPES